MFAYEVLSEMEKYVNLKKPLEDEHLRRLHLNLILALKDLEQSQKFHMGEIGKLPIPDAGTPMFMEYLRLPFVICWFDFTLKMKKMGILANQMADKIILLRHFGLDSKLGWWLYPSASLISVGCLFKENQETSKVFKDLEISSRLAEFAQERNYINLSLYRAGRTADEIENDCLTDVTLLFVTLQLLDCKNITLQPKGPDRALRRRLRDNQAELFTYHTLILKPVGKRQESIPQHLWNNRIHLCRGHFKTFTEEKPLFGKITGRFWWQPSVRGRNKKGVVMKDYAFES